MKVYEKTYLSLFNQITGTINILETELVNLKEIQRKAEQMFIADESNEERTE